MSGPDTDPLIRKRLRRVKLRDKDDDAEGPEAIGRELISEVYPPSRKSFFNLLSNNFTNLICRSDKIELRARDFGREMYSRGSSFTSELYLELPELEVAPIFRNTLYYAMYMHNLNARFIDYTLRSSSGVSLPDLTINVINLASRADRWNLVQSYPLRLFHVRRSEAIRGRSGRGWEGCALSHVGLVEGAKARGAPYLIVAEDDFCNVLEWDCVISAKNSAARKSVSW